MSRTGHFFHYLCDQPLRALLILYATTDTIPHIYCLDRNAHLCSHYRHPSYNHDDRMLDGLWEVF